ncbi:transcription elongation factor SPT6-like [Hydractinia symbiolongicarpus]|uniref:transcription elongation factor SPT6-like n=1 Tax=Hydractinia symbiolongicarpus TaxID=13093 RepID=UPI00254EBC46|nr:transcription elongation factor SPT6-like [Hydractinia symbiolongicarpus]
MSDFFDSEAEESGEDLDETKQKDEDDDDEEDEGDNIDENEINDIIDDRVIEEDDDDEESDEEEGPSRKRKLESDEDEEIDDDDLKLIQENTGLTIKKKKHSRVKLLDSDSDDEVEKPGNDRDQIAQDLFDLADEEDAKSIRSARPTSRQSQQYVAVEQVDESSDEDGDNIDNFIVNDDDEPIKGKKVKKKHTSKRYVDSALQEAQDIFGLEFDLSEFDADVEALDEDVDYDSDLDEEQLAAKMAERKAKKKSKTDIFKVFEPAELEKGHMTLQDNKIKVTDVPERFQLRSISVQFISEEELDEEAEWIYKQAFMQPPISQQNFQDPTDPNKHHTGFEAKNVTAIPRIRAALSFMKKDMFEVPFIAMYRKEYVEPELKKDDLWKVYEWDEKWTQFTKRKENMKRLFEDMQTFQFEVTRNNPDEPLQEGFRILEQEDIDRLDNAQNVEELKDSYLHFQLYYGNNIPSMQDWKEKNDRIKRQGKKTKKKIIRVKKIKEQKKEKPTDVSENNEDKKENTENNKTDPETGEPMEVETDKDANKASETDKEKTGDIDFTTEKEDQNKENEEDEESEYEDKEIEVTDSEAENEPVEEVEERKRRLPKKRDLYTICKDNGLSPMASRFGLTPEQFGENMRDNYQRHEPEQHPQEPLEAAAEFTCNAFPSAEAVLSGARHMVAIQIARNPLVKQTFRQVFYERAKIFITPTKKGKKEIDDFHQAAPFKYLKNKPVRDLHGEQFLKMWHAEQEQLVTIKLSIESENTDPNGYTFIDEIKQLYNRDEFSHLVQEWNKQRADALSLALNKMLCPLVASELKNKLLVESQEFAIQLISLKLRNWISVAPYQPDNNYNENEYNEDHESTRCRVLACSFVPDKNAAAFFAMIDSDGQCVDFLRMKYLLFRRNSFKESERVNKEKDMERLKEFIQKHQPQVIAIAAECRDASNVMEDVSRAVQELQQEQQMSHINVELVDAEVARIYQDSPRAQTEFPEYADVLRHAISLGRRIQEPLLEFSNLCDSEDELLCLRFHPMQEVLPQEILKKRLEIEFINQVNEVGVDVNRALDIPYTAVVTQFLCGLGPRKAANLLKILRQQSCRLENRSQLVTVCEMGLQVFLNCAGFIKIAHSDTNEKYEVLDGTRIHPETYDWPRKMAIDALEYDEGMDENNPSSAVEEILEQPDRLKDLDLDAFAEELARQGYGNKQITLYDIRDELITRFKDHRSVYKGLTSEERFRLLTGETPQTLYYGKLVTCIVTGFAYKKPNREELDSANPTRNDETNLWKCPFCWQDTFPDLSEVWTHFDNGSCPGQAVGVRTRFENGITGFIATKNISDKMVKRPEERVRSGMSLHARVTKINYDRMQLDLTSKSSDLADKQGTFSPARDLYFDQEAADKDRKQEESIKSAQAKRTTYLKRVIAHPSFKNVTFKDAEKLLENMEQGECIVRPSSKGTDHLTVTWKVAKNIYQHIDIREEGKENDFSIGKSLWVENEEYEDLDEIMTRYIGPLSTHAREILSHKYFKETDGTRAKLEEILAVEKRKAPGRIPYFFSTAKQYPGKFMIGYMPRNKPRVEYITITSDGFRYRGRIHANTNNLLKWFKEHFRDPVPGAGHSSSRRTPFGHTPLMMGTTPYTPGSTPANLITEDEAASIMQQAFPPGGMYNMTPGTTPARSTPGYSTPGFSTPGGLTPSRENNFGQWGNNSFNGNTGFNNSYNSSHGKRDRERHHGNRNHNRPDSGQRRHRR